MPVTAGDSQRALAEQTSCRLMVCRVARSRLTSLSLVAVTYALLDNELGIPPRTVLIGLRPRRRCCSLALGAILILRSLAITSAGRRLRSDDPSHTPVAERWPARLLHRHHHSHSPCLPLSVSPSLASRSLPSFSDGHPVPDGCQSTGILPAVPNHDDRTKIRLQTGVSRGIRCSSQRFFASA
ncbi:hypothetical protein TBK1r_51850 [Stieleria magnilauensis]|uniref:Uncharacterized protein n=1 Tax=Stieleria magnilauensis TaxID=2527963 RepID=A0ABX5XVY6_9BACT|nr:hypothetical protein TBK1r_51850 [Planctomycetes bacterium TBK1r]